MARTLRRERPRLGLTGLLVLASLFHFTSGIREVTKAVKEMVTLSCEYNVSMDELARVRVYWQKNSDMVLSIISGNMRVWPDYENRTILDIANRLSLVILALRLSDNGEYTCVVQKMERESFVVRQRLGVRLFVKADFPTPSIIDLGNPSPTIRSILCSTSEGFPEPHLSWWENGEELSAVNTVVSKDPKTELFTVSSELRFNTTSNHSFECLVKFRGLTVSQIFNWQKPRQDSPDNHLWDLNPHLIPGCVAAGVLIVSAVSILIYCKCFTRWRRTEAKTQTRERSAVYTGPAEASG